MTSISRSDKHAPVSFDLAGFSFPSEGEGPVVPLWVRRQLDNIHELLADGHYAKAFFFAERLQRSLAPNAPAEVQLPVRGLAATAKLARGDFDSSEAELLNALSVAKAGELLESALGTSLMNNLAVITFAFHSRPSAAESQFSQALTFIATPEKEEHGQRSLCLRNLGVVQDAQGNIDEAARNLNRALEASDGEPGRMLEIAELLANNRERANDIAAVEAICSGMYAVTDRHRHERPDLFIAAAQNLAVFFLKTADFARLGPVVKDQLMEMKNSTPHDERWRMAAPLLYLALHHGAAGQWGNAAMHISRAVTLDAETPLGQLKAVDSLKRLITFYGSIANTRAADIAREVFRRARTGASDKDR